MAGVRTAVAGGVTEAKSTTVDISKSRTVRKLRWATDATDLGVKLKLSYAVSLIIAQMSDVYQIRYPPSYQSVIGTLFAPLRGQLLGWFPGLHFDCFGIRSLFSQLVFYTLLPLGLCSLRLLTAWRTHQSLLPALPFVLRFFFFVAAIVSSKGFQALAQCDCFPSLDGDEICLKSSDYHVVCPMGAGLAFFAWIAVLLYGISVPVAYATLLYHCREALQTGETTPLSEALCFLTDKLHREALWWPLIEAIRSLLLTGFLALLSPGSITQLLIGLLVAVAFCVLETWCAPYQKPGNNYIALMASMSLVLNFVSSLGVQFNSVSAEGLVNQTLVSFGLFGAAFVVFAVTAFTFCMALRER